MFGGRMGCAEGSLGLFKGGPESAGDGVGNAEGVEEGEEWGRKWGCLRDAQYREEEEKAVIGGVLAGISPAYFDSRM